ncbi:hypothetical protein ACHAXM_009277 [Skeletonema potamos]
MEHNNSQYYHPKHPVDAAAAEQQRMMRHNDHARLEGVHAAVNNHNGGEHSNHHPYFPMHKCGLVNGNEHFRHHCNPNWMSVAIPPPPPPPPHNPFLPLTGLVPSPSGDSQISDDQRPTKRKRRWGPSVNIEQQQQLVKNTTSITEPKKLKEENTSTDSAIDAINALSTLETRWNVPQKKKRHRRKRQKKRKANPANSTQANNLDVDDVWIDVEDVVKIINPSRSARQEIIEDYGGKVLEGVDEVMDFPPLKSKTKEEEEHIRSTLGSTERDLNAMDTSELKSYADVLTRALGSASKNQSSNEDDSEMDISDDEERSVDTPGPDNIVNSTHPEIVSEERASDQSAVAKDKASEDDVRREKEKRALKLAELKAKAKLANAKLRMAIQRKALGSTAKDAEASFAVIANGRNTPPSAAATQQRKRHRHVSTSNSSGLHDISALRNIATLIIPDVSLTGSNEMVRFIDSVYDLSSEDDDFTEEEEEEECKSLSEHPLEAEVALPNDDSQKKPHQSLKQQLQLAKLRLEIKRKEQLLLEKKRKMPVIAPATDSRLPSNNVPRTKVVTNISEDCNDGSEGKSKSIDDGSDLMISSDDKRLKLEQLRRRQKELKHKNEVSNLKNLINRQRQLLRTQGQELTENSAQLERVVSDITSKQNLLDVSKKRLEEMNHRKKIMEGMMLRATEKLMTARKALGQHKQRSLTNGQVSIP